MERRAELAHSDSVGQLAPGHNPVGPCTGRLKPIRDLIGWCTALQTTDRCSEHRLGAAAIAGENVTRIRGSPWRSIDATPRHLLPSMVGS